MMYNMAQSGVAESGSTCVSARCRVYSTNLLVCCGFKALLFLTVSSGNMNFKRVLCCVVLCCVMLLWKSKDHTMPYHHHET